MAECNSRSGDPREKAIDKKIRRFEAKASLYDELVERDANIRVLHFMIVSQLALFLIANIIWDSFLSGQLCLHLYHLLNRFGSLWDCIKMLAVFEVPVLACTMLVHPLFKLWVRARQSLPHLVMDGLFAVLYLGAVLGSFPLTIYTCDSFAFPTFLRVTASIENVRVCMKSYSFIRENAYKVLYPWHKDDKSGPAVWYRGQMSPSVGSFQQYCYYLFCPAMLYRDHYPRNSSIQWRKAALYLLYFWFIMWTVLTLENQYLSLAALTYKDILRCFLGYVLFGIPSALLAHICALHCYLNFGAEVMRFADRQFYSDWWTCTNFAQFYRKWNLLIHEYIHQYVYQDLKSVGVSVRQAGIFLSIALSALLHEYMISMGTGFFSPILITNFAVMGFIFFVWPFKKHSTAKNWMTQFFLGLGAGMMFFLYTLEISSRRFCTEGPDFIGMRMFHCISRYN